MCACPVRREPSLYFLFLRIRLDTTRILVVIMIGMLDRWVPEDKFKFGPFVCEYIAIPVISLPYHTKQ